MVETMTKRITQEPERTLKSNVFVLCGMLSSSMQQEPTESEMDVDFIIRRLGSSKKPFDLQSLENLIEIINSLYSYRKDSRFEIVKILKGKVVYSAKNVRLLYDNLTHNNLRINPDTLEVQISAKPIL